nr:uncharacterized protein LOC109158745 [Ipomoea trifida]
MAFPWNFSHGNKTSENAKTPYSEDSDFDHSDDTKFILKRIMDMFDDGFGFPRAQVYSSPTLAAGINRTHARSASSGWVRKPSDRALMDASRTHASDPRPSERGTGPDLATRTLAGAFARISPAICRTRRKVGSRADARVRPASDATANPEKKEENADALGTRVRYASDGPILGVSADESKMPPKSTASKSRRKECAKKRKHDVGLSSRAAEGESDLLIPGGRSLRHLSGAQIARVEELRAKGASGGYYFDLSMLEAYGCREEVERMMSRPSWRHLFSWRDDTYEPVVHEFIATYTAIPSNHMWIPCMKFTLFDREHEVSLIQLGEILGFYTPEDSRTEEWRNLPTDFYSDAAAEAYWYEITNGRGGRFTGTKPNTSKVVRSPLLMMKLLLNLTFGGRNKNLHKIYRFDLFNLWSLEMNEPIQMACMVQQLFTSQTQPKCPYVWIGPVVTRLCHGLGLQAESWRGRKALPPCNRLQMHISVGATLLGLGPHRDLDGMSSRKSKSR